MENEAQAYLIFTDNPDIFTPDRISMTKDRLAALRDEFFRTMPDGWLRGRLGQVLNDHKSGGGAQR